MHQARIVVTGGSGSVGRIIVPALKVAGHHVTILDTHADQPTNLLHDDLRPLLAGHDTLIHLAAHASPRISPVLAAENVAIADTVIAALEHTPSIHHMVLASSINVYPYFELIAAREQITAATPLSPNRHWSPGAYGASKIEIEEHFTACARTTGRTLAILRLGNVSPYRLSLLDSLRALLPTVEGAILLSQRDLCAAVTEALSPRGICAVVCVSGGRLVAHDMRTEGHPLY